MEEKDVAYVAGFFDGEGSACICGNYSVKVMLVQKEPQVLVWIKDNLGGSIYYRKNGHGTYVLQLGQKYAQEKFLLAIRPYLRVKGNDVDMCLSMLNMSATNSTRPQGANGHFLKNPKQEERRKLYEIYKAYRKKKKQQIPS